MAEGSAWDDLVRQLRDDDVGTMPTAMAGTAFVGVVLTVGLEAGDPPVLRGVFTDPDDAAAAFEEERRRLEIPADDVSIGDHGPEAWAAFVRAGGSYVHLAGPYREVGEGDDRGRRRALLLMWSRLDP